MKRFFAAAAVLMSCCLTLSALDQKAVQMYERGAYAGAMDLFLEDSRDPVSRDYAALCAIRLSLPQAGEMVAQADSTCPSSVLKGEVHRLWGLSLFDKGDFEGAWRNFEAVKESGLAEKELGEFLYKKGNCLLSLGKIPEAKECLSKASRIPAGGYAGAARFCLGSLAYSERDFSGAIDWFSQASSDVRFTELCDFYLVDCRFMLKDYVYVVSAGEKIYDSLSDSRRKHISRLISESYLVLGNANEARRYLEDEDPDHAAKSDADLFHAASVLYATGDYKGAVKYFSRMENMADSLGQIASYELGYSLVRTKNKVAAIAAFRTASELPFDEAIREDAFFNYAKLSYDINSDPSPLRQYVRKYSDARKGDMVYAYLAFSSLREKDYAAAVEYYDLVENLTEEHRSNYIKANYLRACQLLANGSYRDAVPMLKACSYYLRRTDPLGQYSRYLLADCYFRSGMVRDALSLYTDLYNASALYGRKEGKTIPYNIAYCHMKASDYAQASRWFSQYASSGESFARKDALVRKADCEFIQKKYDSALSAYAAVLSEFPSWDDIYPHYQYAKSCAMCGDVKKRIEALAPVLEANPSADYYQDALYELGRAYIDASDEQKAVQAFNLLSENTKDPSIKAKALLGAGLAKRNASKYEEAVRQYEKVVELLPSSGYADDALLSIQAVRQAQGKPELYLEYVEKNNLAPARGEGQKEALYFSTAEQLYLAGNYSGAVTYLGRYLSMYPQGKSVTDAHYYLAESCKALGDKEGALPHYELVAQQEGSSFASLARMNVASLNYSLERYPQAYTAYEAIGDKTGMMRCAFRSKMHWEAISAAQDVCRIASCPEDLLREALYVQAKSYLSTSQRVEAFEILAKLSAMPNTPEGAEAYYLIVRSDFDSGKFQQVKSGVYDFAAKCSDQPYWLAKAFIVLADAFAEEGNLEQALVTLRSVEQGYTASSPDDDVPGTVAIKIKNLESE